MTPFSAWMCGFLAGAATLYEFDPDRGRRRRAMVRDKLRKAANSLAKPAPATWRDVQNRTRGIVSNLAKPFENQEADESTIVARVRSKMGRYVSNPGSIEVTADGGHVHLSGLILEDELQGLIACVESVPGVVNVDHELETHRSEENIPGLQRRRARLGERLNLFEDEWAPSTRLLLGVAGGLLATQSLARRSVMSPLMGFGGAALIVAALGCGSQTGERTRIQAERQRA